MIFGATANGLVDVMNEVEELWFEGDGQPKSEIFWRRSITQGRGFAFKVSSGIRGSPEVLLHHAGSGASERF